MVSYWIKRLHETVEHGQRFSRFFRDGFFNRIDFMFTLGAQNFSKQYRIRTNRGFHRLKGAGFFIDDPANRSIAVLGAHTTRRIRIRIGHRDTDRYRIGQS